MRCLLCALLLASAAAAQNLDVTIKPPHIHTIPYNCKGKPDHVYAREDATYYACLNSKDVCSKEKNVTIPSSLLAAFQELERQYNTRPAQGRIMASKIAEDAKTVRQRQGQSAAVPAPAPVVLRVSEADLAQGTARPPIADDRLQQVRAGTSRAELVEQFGEPHMKISGDVEYYTYVLASGDSAQVEIEGGAVKRVQIVKK